MFEDSLFTSRPQRTGSRMRSIALLSVAVQALALVGMDVVPLFHPETLPVVSAAPRAVVLEPKPLPRVAPPKPQIMRVSSTQAVSAPATPAPHVEQTHGGSIARNTAPAVSDDAPLIASGNSMRRAPLVGFGPGLGESGNPGVPVRVAPAAAPAAKPTLLHVSSGVSAGLLINRIEPVYPAIAKAAHQSGTVVVEATIDKVGRIVGARAISGPMMLQGAAVEAVSKARYKPFLLNGQPTDVETTVSINFTFAS